MKGCLKALDILGLFLSLATLFLFWFGVFCLGLVFLMVVQKYLRIIDKLILETVRDSCIFTLV